MFKAKLFNNKDEDCDMLRMPFYKVDLNNVKHKEVPTTGEEFLVSVIAERQNIEEITRCDVDYTHFSRNQSLFVDESPLPPAPENLKPTKEWQNMQVADFSDIRSAISRMIIRNPIKANNIKKVRIKKDDVDSWRKFFNDHDIIPLACVLGFDAMQVDLGLEMLTELLKEVKPGDSIDIIAGRWIYALLAALKHPLQSDTISIIRELARQCATIRSRIDPDGVNAAGLVNPLNIIICLIGNYFRQLDLADSLE